MSQANGRKPIFNTGAASGIGRATALLFARHGWFVGAYDVNQKDLTVALSIELKRDRVRAAGLLPGLVNTPLLSDKLRAMAPPEGMWRLVPPPEVVAETVLAAYPRDRRHWYVPADLQAFEIEVATNPEQVRDERTALAAAMAE